MAEATRGPGTRWRLVLLALAALLLVAGAGVGIAGRSSAASADDDLVAAEADLDDAEERLGGARTDADAAAGRLEATELAAGETLAAAQRVAEAGRELCGCDQERAVLATQAVQAILDGRFEDYNALLDELDAWAEDANDMLEDIDEALPQVQAVGEGG